MERSLTTVGAMTFGIILPNKGEGAGPELLDAACAAATAAGWRSAWVTDHLMVPRGPEADEYGVMLEALTTLAWAGGRYEDLVFGTSVISPAMRDAPMLAKELATIDVLLGGRLIVGVGVSDTDDLPEYTNMGKAERFTRRGVYVDEAIRLWRHLWSGSTEPFEGEFHQLTDFSFGPLPVQGAASRSGPAAAAPVPCDAPPNSPTATTPPRPGRATSTIGCRNCARPSRSRVARGRSSPRAPACGSTRSRGRLLDVWQRRDDRG